MIKSITLSAISLLAVAASVFAAAEKDAMMETEKAVWQSVQDKKYDAFRKYFASNYRAAYAQGLFNLDQEMDSVRKADLKSFSLSDSTVVMPSKDTVLLTYKSTTQGTQDGKDMSGTWNCASVWHKSGADWKVVFHAEVKAE
jgi:hypothetical protein